MADVIAALEGRVTEQSLSELACATEELRDAALPRWEPRTLTTRRSRPARPTDLRDDGAGS